MRTLCPVLVGAVLAAHAYGDFRVIPDILDATDGLPMPSPHILVIDVLYDYDDDMWTATGLRGITFGGVQLRYSEEHEPNFPDRPALINPGLADRFVTFFSRPRSRDADAGFIRGGAHVAGPYSPETWVPIATASEINFAGFNSPPMTHCAPIPDGYVARVALDISAVIPFLSSDIVLVVNGDPSAGYSPLFVSACASPNDRGTVAATFEQPGFAGVDWGIYAVLRAPQTLAGDLDGDCDVDVRDLATLLSHFGTPPGGGATLEDGDIFGDGGVDLTDLAALLQRFGERCP